jgi:hypothetical protein
MEEGRGKREDERWKKKDGKSLFIYWTIRGKIFVEGKGEKYIYFLDNQL